jgi:hypothetical protein
MCSCNIQVYDGKESIVRTEDQTVAFVRPRYFVGSSGSVWESETIDLRTMVPDLYDIPNSTSYCKQFLTVCHTIGSKITHFIDATMEADVAEVTTTNECPFKECELKRLSNLKTYLLLGAEMVDTAHELNDNEEKKVEDLQKYITMLTKKVEQLDSVVGQKTGSKLWKLYQSLLTTMKKVIHLFHEWNLPQVKCRLLEFTDGGPGVGVNNIDVRVRTD